MCERIGASDAEWALIGPLLPSERGLGCRLAGDNRPYFEGMVCMPLTGARRRHLLDEYGRWNSVFRRYHRWVVAGVFEAMLETLAAAVEWDAGADIIGSTVVRADHCAVGLKKGSGVQGARSIARRLYDQAARALRWPGKTAMFRPDTKASP